MGVQCTCKWNAHCWSLFGRGSAPDHAGGAYDAATLPKSHSRLGRRRPLPILFSLDAFGVSISEPSVPRFTAPNTNSWQSHWVRVEKGRGRKAGREKRETCPVWEKQKMAALRARSSRLQRAQSGRVPLSIFRKSAPMLKHMIWMSCGRAHLTI